MPAVKPPQLFGNFSDSKWRSGTRSWVPLTRRWRRKDIQLQLTFKALFSIRKKGQNGWNKTHTLIPFVAVIYWFIRWLFYTVSDIHVAVSIQTVCEPAWSHCVEEKVDKIISLISVFSSSFTKCIQLCFPSPLVNVMVVLGIRLLSVPVYDWKVVICWLRSLSSSSSHSVAGHFTN